MKMKILLLIIAIETTLIAFFIFQDRMLHDFSITRNKEIPFHYSFDFVFSKSKDTYGSIALGHDGQLMYIFIKDKKGRLVAIGYNDDGIVSYKISDKISSYDIETYFTNNIFQGENGSKNYIISRTEILGNVKKNYIIDYNTAPYFFINN